MLRQFEYQGTAITFDLDGDTYVNATEMAKPFGKRPIDFLRLKSTQDYITELESEVRIPHITRRGNYSDEIEQGTWMHELLALEFAGWLSPAFRIWCNKVLRDLLTSGSFSDSNTGGDNMQMLRMQMQAMNQMFEQIETGQRSIRRIEQKVDVLEARMVTMPQDYFAIAGYATLIRRPINVAMAATLGKKAKSLCRKYGYNTGAIPDPRFGKVNTYPRVVLEEVFRQYFH